MSAVVEATPRYTTERKLCNQHTNKLINKHRDLDQAIREGSRLSLSLDLLSKKTERTHIKDELMRRIRAGDSNAVAYGEERRWIGSAG